MQVAIGRKMLTGRNPFSDSAYLLLVSEPHLLSNDDNFQFLLNRSSFSGYYSRLGWESSGIAASRISINQPTVSKYWMGRRALLNAGQ